MSKPFQIKSPSGEIIRGDVHSPLSKGNQACPAMIVCHGFKGFKDWGFFPYLCDRMAEAGTVAVRFNFSHNGVGEDLLNFTELDKFSKNTLSREIEDLEAVIDALFEGRLVETGNLDLNHVGILGHSRGAASTILVGSKDPRIKTLVTWAGIGRIDRYSEDVKRLWREEGKLVVPNVRTGQEMPMDLAVLEDIEQNADKYDLAAAVSGLTIPFLAVHGDEDETVPFSEASILHDRAPRGLRSLQLIPGGGHTFETGHPWEGTSPELEEAIRVTLEWIANRL
jgi:dienelactone hydrolase